MNKYPKKQLESVLLKTLKKQEAEKPLSLHPDINVLNIGTRQTEINVLNIGTRHTQSKVLNIGTRNTEINILNIGTRHNEINVFKYRYQTQ